MARRAIRIGTELHAQGIRMHSTTVCACVAVCGCAKIIFPTPPPCFSSHTHTRRALFFARIRPALLRAEPHRPGRVSLKHMSDLGDRSNQVPLLAISLSLRLPFVHRRGPTLSFSRQTYPPTMPSRVLSPLSRSLRLWSANFHFLRAASLARSSMQMALKKLCADSFLPSRWVSGCFCCPVARTHDRARVPECFCHATGHGHGTLLKTKTEA